jgi:hypothetical protein
LPLVKELSVKSLLRLDGASDVCSFEANPNSAFLVALVNLDLHNFAVVIAAGFNLVLDINEEARILFKVDSPGVEHIREQETIAWVALNQAHLLLFDRLGLLRTQIADVFVAHKFLHELCSGLR